MRHRYKGAIIGAIVGLISEIIFNLYPLETGETVAIIASTLWGLILGTIIGWLIEKIKND